MKKNTSKKIIVPLIIDDLRYYCDTWLLNNLGFDNVKLDIRTTIFLLMELNTNDKRLEHLTDQYCERTHQIIEFPIYDQEWIELLAIEIYDWLTLERKRYLKLLSKL